MSKNGKKVDAPQVPPVDWKTFDIRKSTVQDLHAAISLLCLIRDKPDVYEAVVKALEDYRHRLIVMEEEQKEVPQVDPAQTQMFTV